MAKLKTEKFGVCYNLIDGGIEQTEEICKTKYNTLQKRWNAKALESMELEPEFQIRRYQREIKTEKSTVYYTSYNCGCSQFILMHEVCDEGFAFAPKKGGKKA